MIEKGKVATFESKGEGFDEWRFGLGCGAEAADGQAFLNERFDIWFSDAVDFGPDDMGFPAFYEGAEAIALQGPADLVEAIEGDDLFGVGVDDGDGGVVFIASPVDAGDVLMAGHWFGGGCGDGVADITEDLAGLVDELCLVFGSPDGIGGMPADVFQFLRRDKGVCGGGEMEGFPLVLERIQAEVEEVTEPVLAVGRTEEDSAAQG